MAMVIDYLLNLERVVLLELGGSDFHIDELSHNQKKDQLSFGLQAVSLAYSYIIGHLEV